MDIETAEKPDLAKSKRDRILEAAATVFCQDGYTGASIDAVATKAGVSRQTIYNHVGDKDGLFKEVVAALTDKSAAKFLLLMEEFPDRPENIEAELTAFSSRFLNHLTQDKTSRWLLRLAENESGRYPELFTVWREYGSGRKRSMVAAHLSQLALAGHLDIDDPTLAARQYLALLTAEWRAEFQLGRFPSEEECAGMAERAVKTFLRAFGRR
ncbi:MAG TPA: TetR/AcrR family transcriptional regulator [Ensifer sp.]|nr:TetR/AcrR family transcriptional regulator [Ensifer sp.]